MSTSERKTRGVEDQPASKSGRHAVESARRFWFRTVAGGSAKSLRGVGSLLALATAGAFASALVGGIWYLAIGDLLDDKGTAATSAIAGAVAIWILLTGFGGRAILGRKRNTPGSDRRRHSR